ncbi:hypothetical protein GCM10009304_25020 [Pseudomonas matsuisoli]|uniref:Uncharacterized protein n=1 Tax=Pseudomonas matsuisoli TaxID=1515666 RepID=A0A917UYW1_9PSED|nr:hypothetical protein GCM10009304_25020 [Pseudomonas matsuisoli]
MKAALALAPGVPSALGWGWGWGAASVGPLLQAVRNISDKPTVRWRNAKPGAKTSNIRSSRVLRTGADLTMHQSV